MAQIQIRRGVDWNYVIAFQDSGEPPRPINFVGSKLSVIFVGGQTRIVKTTPTEVVYRDLYDPAAIDDPRGGTISVTLSADETWSLPQTAVRMEIRRAIGGRVESIADIPVQITDWTGTRGRGV